MAKCNQLTSLSFKELIWSGATPSSSCAVLMEVSTYARHVAITTSVQLTEDILCVCHLRYSGCEMASHWTWLTKPTSLYRMMVTWLSARRACATPETTVVGRRTSSDVGSATPHVLASTVFASLLYHIQWHWVALLYYFLEPISV